MYQWHSHGGEWWYMGEVSHHRSPGTLLKNNLLNTLEKYKISSVKQVTICSFIINIIPR